jgi:hypothetical protein
MEKESEIIFYQGDDGIVKIEVFYHGETFWMTQKKISELFGVQRPAITKHLTNIFESGELSEESVSSILEHTADDGKNYFGFIKLSNTKRQRKGFCIRSKIKS